MERRRRQRILKFEISIGKENLINGRNVPVICQESKENKEWKGGRRGFLKEHHWAQRSLFRIKNQLGEGGDKAALKDLHTSHSILWAALNSCCITSSSWACLWQRFAPHESAQNVRKHPSDSLESWSYCPKTAQQEKKSWGVEGAFKENLCLWGYLKMLLFS